MSERTENTQQNDKPSLIQRFMAGAAVLNGHSNPLMGFDYFRTLERNAKGEKTPKPSGP